MPSTKRQPRRKPRSAPVGPKPTSKDIERRLIRLGYRAMAIGINHAHLGETWLRHFGAKSERFFDLANREWRNAGL